jgi:dienelactone hydrolase
MKQPSGTGGLAGGGARAAAVLRLAFWAAGLMAGAAGAAACGGCGGGGKDAGATDADSGPPPNEVLLFRPPGDGSPAPFGDIPFPSDLYRDADGTLVDDIPGFDRIVGANGASLAAGLAPLDGFARTTAAYFFVSGGELEPGTLPQTAPDSVGPASSVMLIDVDPASPDFGTHLPVLTRYMPSLQGLAVLPHPGTVLAPHTRYAAVVTIQVMYMPCLPYDRDAELDRILTLPAAARATPAELLYGETLDTLLGLGVVSDPTFVTGLAVFTTGDATADLVAVARDVADVAAYPDPALDTDPASIAPFNPFLVGASGTTPTLDDWLGTPDDDANGLDWPGGDNAGGRAHDAIGAVVTGAFASRLFLGAGGHFVPDDGSGPPEAQGTWLAPVTFVLPAAAPPPAGWPVVIYGHGLGGSRASMMSVANEYARAGFAVASIDFVYHGTRDGIPDVANEYPGTYDGPDGFADMGGNNFTFFAFFQDVGAMRDNFRQTIADLLSLVRLVRSPALDLGAAAPLLGFAPALDAGNVFYTGNSLGGIMGVTFAAYAADVRAAAPVVPGGGFVHLLGANSAGFRGLIDNVFGVVYGALGNEPYDSFHPLGNLIEMGFEPADPIVHAGHLVLDPVPLGPGGAALDPRNVLIVYTLGDETVPNRATDALLDAAGLPVVAPLLVAADAFGLSLPGDGSAAPIAGNFGGGVATAGAVQYAPATHGLGASRWGTRNYLPGFPVDGADDRFPALAAPVTIEMPIREVLAQIVHFFQTALDGTAAPEIISTAPPVADFDGDGVTDADEMAAGTDPYDPTSL